MKAILRSSQLSYELLERIALQIRAADEKKATEAQKTKKRRSG